MLFQNIYTVCHIVIDKKENKKMNDELVKCEYCCQRQEDTGTCKYCGAPLADHKEDRKIDSFSMFIRKIEETQEWGTPW